MPRPQRRMQVLPLSILMALLGALLAILASAGPTMRGIGEGDRPPLILILDRGLTMSAEGPTGTRFQEAARALVTALGSQSPSQRIDLIPVPGDSTIHTTVSDCARQIASIAPTARQSAPHLAQTISAQLAGSSQPILILSDQPIPVRDRLIQIPPASSVADVGIALLAARDRPSPQVMVRVRNQSDLRAASLVVSCEGIVQRQMIDLPARGDLRDYFFTPSRLAAVVSAELMVKDDVTADDRAWLVREGDSPAIEARVAVSAELRRLIDAYQRSRPATDDSNRLAVVGETAQLPLNAPAILLAPSRASSISGPIRVVPGPLTDHVSWDQLPMPVRISDDPPPGWTPIVSINGRAIIATRPDAPRQVWIGFDAPDWPRTTDYVVFWTNVFDWAGGGGEQFVGHPLGDWTPEWKPTDPAHPEPGAWPGLYHRSDGALRAFNAPDVIIPVPPRADWRSRVASLKESAGLKLSGPLLVAVAGCLAIAAGLWKKPRRSERDLDSAVGKGAEKALAPGKL